MPKKPRTETLKEFSHKNKDLLCIFANPGTDEIMVSFDDKIAYVKFPEVVKPEDRIVFRALFDSVKFQENSEVFLAGLMKATGIDVEKANEFYQAIGGSVQSINDSINGIQKK